MKILERLTGFARQVEEATRTITGDIAQLREAITSKRTAVDRARRALLPPDEIAARIAELVAAYRAEWLKNNGRGLLTQLGKWDERGRLPWGFRTPLTFQELCVIAPDLVTERLANVARTTEYQPGAPASERPKLIEQHEAELAELERREEEIVDAATAAGVQIAHRVEVTERRVHEARQRERADAAVAERQAREAAINQRHEAQAGGVRSPYLESGRAARSALRSS